MAVFNITDNLKVHGTITDSAGKIVFGGTEVSKNSGAAVGTRKTLNLIEGTNITLTIADDVGGDEIDVTIAASGGATVDQIWDETDTAHTTADSFGKTLRDFADELLATKQLGFGTFEGAPANGSVLPISGGTDTYGSILELIASCAFKVRAMFIAARNIDTDSNSIQTKFTITTGTATSEVELIEELPMLGMTSATILDHGQFFAMIPVDIASGTRIGVKAKDNRASLIDYEVSTMLMGD